MQKTISSHKFDSLLSFPKLDQNHILIYNKLQSKKLQPFSNIFFPTENIPTSYLTNYFYLFLSKEEKRKSLKSSNSIAATLVVYMFIVLYVIYIKKRFIIFHYISIEQNVSIQKLAQIDNILFLFSSPFVCSLVNT